MNLAGNLPLALCVAAGLAVACDLAEVDEGSAATDFSAVGETAHEDPERDRMFYENDDDYAVLNDRANLRSATTSEVEHRKNLQRSSLAEMNLVFSENSPQEDLALIALRWFMRGDGIVVQNKSDRTFSMVAHFTSSAEDTCQVTTARRSVGPSGSLILDPAKFGRESKVCKFDRASVTVNDEYGLLADIITVQRSEAEL